MYDGITLKSLGGIRMKRKLVCFVALILCLTLGVTAAMADGACGLGDAVVASWDGEAAPHPRLLRRDT